jgi:hypothetical protein
MLVAIAFALWPRHAVGETYLLSQMLWHDDEAFVFVSVSRKGWNTGYAYWLFASLGIYGPPAQDSSRLTSVFRITSTELEEFTLDSAPPGLIAADGYLSTYDKRWIRGRFEPYVPTSIPEPFANHLPQEFSDVEGWSKRSFNVPPGGARGTVAFDLGERPARLVLSSDAGIRSIDLEREGLSVHRLVSSPERVRWVSRAEYDEFLNK